jgi:asparagine synthase (glutamine-hydrolysing)
VCGISGLMSLAGAPVDGVALRRMTDHLRHRGPDGEGFELFDTAGLGHRRLSIIDLEGGRQPLANEDRTIWVTFNGEIYNFRDLTRELKVAGHSFRTRSDSEVLVHAYEEWGDSCVERLRGMFAFAIWDARRRRLFLARDRVGIKPLYYLQQAGIFAFASEMQAFRGLPTFAPTIDLQALDLYLHFQYVPAPFSIFNEVRKLPAGHTLCVEHDGRLIGPRRYWQLSFRPNHRLSEREWLDRLDHALKDAVGAHLVSDVPFGAFLSGGVDSSTVVAYMSAALADPIHTFSIRLENESLDESPYARSVAERCGTLHHEEVVHPDLAVLPQLVRHYGEPFADSSALPTYYVSRLAAGHVKMVLSGDGGDENFAGYASYPGVLDGWPAPKGLGLRLRNVVGNIARGAGLRPPLPDASRPSRRWYDGVAYFGHDERTRLWNPQHHALLDGTRAWLEEQYSKSRQDELCSHLQRLDIDTYLPNDILTKVDVASMCHGLEVRVPLLDHVFMESVAEMPADWKLHRDGRFETDEAPGATGSTSAWVGKYLLKRNGERFFERDFLNRPKRGFGIPLDDWIRGPMREEIRERLGEVASAWAEFFDPGYIHDLLARHDTGGTNGARLWSLLFLAEWTKQNRGPSGTVL